MLRPSTKLSRAFAIAACCTASLAAAAEETSGFEAGVLRIFKTNCIACHGASAPQGKLDLRTPSSILKGGASGPAVVAGAPDRSLLIDKVATRQMPPGKQKLSDAEVDQLRTWIATDLYPAVESAPVTAASVTEPEVRAILQVRCVVCHGNSRREGDLDLRTIASRLKG